MKKPKRLFRERPGPDWGPLIDALTDDPALRHAMREAIAALDSAAMRRAFAAVAPGERGGILLAMKDAALHLRDRKPCDLCAATATRIRPQVIGPDADFAGPGVRREDDRQGFIGFAVACAACGAMPDAAFERAMLAKVARLQAEDPGYSPASHRRAALIGDRIGAAGHLPPRAVLRTCEGCSATIWIDQDEHAAVAGPRSNACFVCRRCAADYYAAGRLECVPTGFIS